MTSVVRNHRLSIDRRMLLGGLSTAALVGGWPRFDAAFAAVEPQLSMMGWADYISPTDVADWEKANNSKADL